jgi:hypothetical protein
MQNTNIDNHWAVCDKTGAIRYDGNGRAEIYGTRSTARSRSAKISAEYGEQMHVEKVEIRKAGACAHLEGEIHDFWAENSNFHSA